MLAREIWSYAPMPSMLNMVVRGSDSVAARNARTRASGPTRVLSAYWNGAQACLKCSANCCASVRLTRRRKTSPITSARTPPLGLLNATMRPKRSASTTGGRDVGPRKFSRCLLVVQQGPVQSADSAVVCTGPEGRPTSLA